MTTPPTDPQTPELPLCDWCEAIPEWRKLTGIRLPGECQPGCRNYRPDPAEPAAHRGAHRKAAEYELRAERSGKCQAGLQGEVQRARQDYNRAHQEAYEARAERDQARTAALKEAARAIEALKSSNVPKDVVCPECEAAFSEEFDFEERKAILRSDAIAAIRALIPPTPTQGEK